MMSANAWLVSKRLGSGLQAHHTAWQSAYTTTAWFKRGNVHLSHLVTEFFLLCFPSP